MSTTTVVVDPKKKVEVKPKPKPKNQDKVQNLTNQMKNLTVGQRNALAYKLGQMNLSNKREEIKVITKPTKKKNKPKVKPKKKGNKKLGQYAMSLLDPFLPLSPKIPDVITLPTGTFRTLDTFNLVCTTSGETALIVHPRPYKMYATLSSVTAGTYTYSALANTANYTGVYGNWLQVRPVSCGVKLTSTTNSSNNQGLVAGGWGARCADGTAVVTSYAASLNMADMSSGVAKLSYQLKWKPQDNADLEFFVTNGTQQPMPFVWFTVSGGPTSATTLYQVTIECHFEGLPTNTGSNMSTITHSPNMPEQMKEASDVLNTMATFTQMGLGALGGAAAMGGTLYAANQGRGGRAGRAVHGFVLPE